VIVYASLLVAGGVLSDRRGRKGMFISGMAVFGLGSLIGGIAPSVGWVICGRVVQGLGPAVGGALVVGIAWRSVFLLNVPLAAAAVALAARFVPRLPRGAVVGPFDWTGAILTTGGVGLPTFGLIEGPVRGGVRP
jgi:MFS transporter, DHA2 family, methylenomycin A resistance protein